MFRLGRWCRPCRARRDESPQPVRRMTTAGSSADARRPRAAGAEHPVEAGFEGAGAHGEIQHGVAPANMVRAPETAAQPVAIDTNLLRFGWRACRLQPVFHFAERYQ